MFSSSSYWPVQRAPVIHLMSKKFSFPSCNTLTYSEPALTMHYGPSYWDSGFVYPRQQDVWPEMTITAVIQRNTRLAHTKDRSWSTNHDSSCRFIEPGGDLHSPIFVVTSPCACVGELSTSLGLQYVCVAGFMSWSG